ncbi:MAG: transporter substrate-binding domain-containing protein, partial [Proteobacteria bacterium]|nr:transporter substrate-binding domain-containing protein [Pseudomonadota bacterium]
PDRLVSSPNIILALRRLADGTTDVYVDTESPVDAALKNNPDLGKLGIRKVGVVESITTHAFLHQKNRDLVPKLAAVLRKMRKEGMIERLRLR